MMSSNNWHYESKFILELVYIVSVSHEIFKIHGRQRWFFPTARFYRPFIKLVNE